MPPKLRGAVRQTERSCESALRERGLQLGRYWLGQFADCSLRANFAEVHLIRWLKIGNETTEAHCRCSSSSSPVNYL